MSNFHGKLSVESPDVRYTDQFIDASYLYRRNVVERYGEIHKVLHKDVRYHFRTKRAVPKLGVMLVGWGGNNGSTLTGTIIANQLKISWPTKSSTQEANYYGSLTQASTVSIGRDESGQNVTIPMADLLPMVHPNDIQLDGWDISALDLGESMRRAQVFDVVLQDQLYEHMKDLHPRPSIFDINFVAPNQQERADNVLIGSKTELVEKIRADIRDFKSQSGVDKVIVLWTANTERFCEVSAELNGTWRSLEKNIKKNHSEISPSIMFAVASILEGNTFVPGVIELAEREGVFIAGDDFKSGQTKLKSVLVDFLVSAGIKPASIVSYNHLGNNDGKNLSYPLTFRSKEISKTNVVDDMVASNAVLYKPGEMPDHCIVIKYIPYVGDTKRAMDEYISEIMMGGRNTLAIHNTCEDSLLASPLILDLVILTELCQRITFRVDDDPEFQRMNSILSVLSILLKAPLVPHGTPIVNAFFKQRACLENILKICAGLAPEDNTLLEFKHSKPKETVSAAKLYGFQGLKRRADFEEVVVNRNGDGCTWEEETGHMTDGV